MLFMEVMLSVITLKEPSFPDSLRAFLTAISGAGHCWPLVSTIRILLKNK
jgi:hypothetical protein